MTNEEFGSCDNIIRDGRRLEIFFKKNGLGHLYVKNINVISEANEKIGRDYKSWLREVEIPKIRDRILEAIENDFLIGKIDDNCHKCRIELHKTLFDMYEDIVDRHVTEREYLRAYV